MRLISLSLLIMRSVLRRRFILLICMTCRGGHATGLMFAWMLAR